MILEHCLPESYEITYVYDECSYTKIFYTQDEMNEFIHTSDNIKIQRVVKVIDMTHEYA